jgi:putative membrane protein
MTSLLLRWVFSALALLVVAYFVPGVSVSGFVAALIAAAAIGFINATLGAVIKFFAWPFRLLSLGLLSLVINGLMLMLAAALVPGFRVDSFIAALLGSILLSIVTAIFEWFLPSEKGRNSASAK